MTEKEFYIWAGERHKSIRLSKGITQPELAQETGIDQSIISKFENNGKKISTFRLKQLLEAMGSSLADLEPSDPSSEKKTPSTSIYPCQPVMA
jgi:transcriptional regulator with XRE-family HTH domain